MGGIFFFLMFERELSRSFLSDCGFFFVLYTTIGFGFVGPFRDVSSLPFRLPPFSVGKKKAVGTACIHGLIEGDMGLQFSAVWIVFVYILYPRTRMVPRIPRCLFIYYIGTIFFVVSMESDGDASCR